jgi:hypothetical protein
MLTAMLCCAVLCCAVHGVLQGGTMAYALLSAMPEYQDKISVVIQLGPVAFIEYFMAPVTSKYAEFWGHKVSLATAHGWRE